MKKLLTLVTALAAACTHPVVNPIRDCEVACTEDADCLGSQTCGELGLCTTDTVCDTGTCEPGAFLGCDDADTARRCDAEGVAVARESCGGFGCNADAARCNECATGESTCAGNSVETCGADGLVATTESCGLGCTLFGARCQTIEPAHLPGVCDTRAPSTGLGLAFPTTIDTDVDATCNGGVIAQVGGPEICVVRHATIAITSSVTVVGARAIAFVSDGPLDLTGLLDVSANGGVAGPGGGLRTSGGAPTSAGGGGAGFKQAGALGGGVGEFGSGAGAGGAISDPLLTEIFEGGARAANGPLSSKSNYRPIGGGGGGALLLVSCEGTVRITGTIDAGGGGGGGGGDVVNTTIGTTLVGGAGGGAGGYVVMQGAQVIVNGGVFANGGGGGGGCSTNDCIGRTGQDGATNNLGGRGGAGIGEGAAGGAGGANTTAPANGTNSPSVSPGGGGGSTGRIQIYTPAGVAPVTAGTIQPPLEPSRTVGVR